MEKAYESERIYEINSDEWFLGRLLGMPQSQIQKSLEKTKPQHIAADHSLQMISNLEKKLSELRGEILETIQKGDNEPRYYNENYSPPKGYTPSGYYEKEYYNVPTTPSDGATNWKQRNPDLRSAPNDTAMRNNSEAINRGKPKPKRPDFANGNPYGESETGDWRETPNPPADHPNFRAMRPPQQVMGPYNGPPERNPYNQDPIESFVEAGRVIRDKVTDGVKNVKNYFNNTVEKAGNYSPETYPEDPRYPPENWNNDQDPRFQRTGVSQAPPMSIDDIINSGRGIGRSIGKEMPSNIRSKTSQTPPDEDADGPLGGSPRDVGSYGKTPQTPQTPPDEDADGPLGGSPKDVGSYGKNEPDYRNIKLPPMKPIPQPIGPKIDQNKPKMIPPAMRNKIPPRGDFNSPLAPVAQDNNELKASFGGNTHETYRLLEDDGHVLRRGLTAENYEMIKGLAVVLRISETEVLHRLEKNGAL